MEWELAKKIKRAFPAMLRKGRLAACGLLILFILSPLLGQSKVLAAEGVVTATVSVNPLSVSVSAPDSVFVDQHFKVEANIENYGSNKIKEALAIIQLPQGLTLKGKCERTIGMIPPHKKKTVAWRVRATEVGTYVIQVSVSGRDEATDALLTAQGSTIVTVKAGESTRSKSGGVMWSATGRL